MQVNQLVVRELEREGIDPEGLAVLCVIAMQGPITPTALAGEIGFRLTTISDIVQRLERAGRVKRRPNPDDRRSFFLTTSRAGDALLQRAAPAFRRGLDLIEQELDRPTEEIEAALDDLRSAVKRALSTPDS